MTTKEELLALAERVEGATGPDIEIDMLIDAAVNSIAVSYPVGSGRVEGDGTKGQAALRGWVDPGKHQINFTPYGTYPAYTGSLDAAMTLALNAWDHMQVYRPDHQTLGWTVYLKPNANLRRKGWEGFASTHELALTAAAIRARAASL